MTDSKEHLAAGDWLVGVDIGGTFTDVVAVDASSGDTRYLKVSSNRADPASAVLRGIEALRDEEGIDPADLRLLMHGTTLATNAIIERKLAATAMVTTRGFRDVLEIARTWRTDLYDPFFDQAPPLISRDLRFEVDERVGADGEIIEPLTAESIEELIVTLRATGVQSVAIAFLHSYREPKHEAMVASALREAGGWYVCASSELMREIREYERSATTVLNAALMPLIDTYLDKLSASLDEAGAPVSLFISQSNGGTQTPQLARERPVSLALSGPVAGVVAEVEIGRQLGLTELIGLDMGGTSTDVSIITDGEPRYTTQLSVGDLPVRLPSVHINAIGAGGGSIARVDAGGALRVGPQSAGSDPGPAAYGNGGTQPTVTDSQLLLGRLSPDVPLAGRLKLDTERSADAVRLAIGDPLGFDVPTAASGIVEVANAAMEGAVRVSLRDRGDDPRDFALVAFGGAGPLHAVELARSLNIGTVVVPAHPGTLCAYGLLNAEVRLDFSASELHRSDEPDLTAVLEAIFTSLERDATGRLGSEKNLDVSQLTLERICEVRYMGQAYEVAVPLAGGDVTRESVATAVAEFHGRHHRAFAFSDPDDPVEFVTYRVVAAVPAEMPETTVETASGVPSPIGRRDVYEIGKGFAPTPIWDRAELPVGFEVSGPAVIQQTDTTTWLPSYATAIVDPTGNMLVHIFLESKQGAD